MWAGKGNKFGQRWFENTPGIKGRVLLLPQAV